MPDATFNCNNGTDAVQQQSCPLPNRSISPRAHLLQKSAQREKSPRQFVPRKSMPRLGCSSLHARKALPCSHNEQLYRHSVSAIIQTGSKKPGDANESGLTPRSDARRVLQAPLQGPLSRRMGSGLVSAMDQVITGIKII